MEKIFLYYFVGIIAIIFSFIALSAIEYLKAYYYKKKYHRQIYEKESKPFKENIKKLYDQNAQLRKIINDLELKEKFVLRLKDIKEKQK